jgi:acyl-CoA synthetase (AMP-forming)/AMP-acid ligase II
MIFFKGYGSTETSGIATFTSPFDSIRLFMLCTDLTILFSDYGNAGYAFDGCTIKLVDVPEMVFILFALIYLILKGLFCE